MGIAPYKTFTFDGESSANYGVYLTGEGVFNAPVRDVEMITIPGRNGAFALDQGRYENIEVTYKAGMFDVTESNFAQKISDFRNWICSKIGYCRLSDDYNTGEYRMAIFKSGIEVDHDFLIAGEFEITFECKPQRWMTSGENPIAVASGGTLTNPTIFESNPLLSFNGHGDISFNNATITVRQNKPIGRVQISEAQSTIGWTIINTFDTTFLMPGDTINAMHHDVGVFRPFVKSNGASVESYTVNNGTWWDGSYATYHDEFFYPQIFATDAVTFNFGTVKTYNDNVTYTLTMSDGTTKTVTAGIQLQYDGSDTITMSMLGITVPTGWDSDYGLNLNSLVGWSTMPANFNINIDLDTGEAYINDGGNIASINDAVIIPADLPVLAPGSNTFTYDNTITNFKVIPRWAKL